MEPKDNDGQVRRNWSMDNLPSRLMQKREEELSGAPSKAPAPKAGEALSLYDLSWPPTQEQLEHYKPVPPSKLPKKFRRDPFTRIYVNRDLRLDKITYYGFDMDYTLASYNSPYYESLSYDLMTAKLLDMGYPDELKSFKYDANYPIRGLFLDKETGNFLKVDNYGTISICVHGKQKYDKRMTAEHYPGLRVSVDQIGGRYYLINTLFSVPEAALYADLVDLFDSFKNQKRIEYDVSYANIFHDLRTAMDFVHLNGSLKAETLANLPKYIKKDGKLVHLLSAFRRAGKKSFLLTNSEWYYTNAVMAYMLSDSGQPEWTSHFDIVIVNANKPKFFEEGSTLREIDVKTGKTTLVPVKAFLPQKVYAGGSIAAFHKLTNVPGEQVLYIGDHIFADVIRSKKTYGWRTLLIVPELTHEVNMWKQNEHIYYRLLNLEWMRAEMYRGLEADSDIPPDTTVLRREIKATREEWNAVFNKYYGSLFRSGSKQSFFSMQVLRYADIYTSEYSNLLKYPLFYLFAASVGFAPHENEYRGENMVPQ